MIRGWHGSPALPIRWPVRVFDIGAIPHGFRSSFRDWAAECSDAPREVCELALAHMDTNAIEAAYRGTDLFERRRALMEQWAAFLNGPARRRESGTVRHPSIAEQTRHSQDDPTPDALEGLGHRTPTRRSSSSHAAIPESPSPVGLSTNLEIQAPER